MLKKSKKLALGALVVLFGFLFILISFPLPQSITEMLLTAKLNNFLPGYSVELDRAKFYFFKGLTAESIRIVKDSQAVSTFEKLKLTYTTPFVFIGRGRLKLTSGILNIKKFSAASELLSFLSSILDSSFEDELVFESFLLESDINKRKIIIDSLEIIGEDLKIVANGYIEKGQKIDFIIDVVLSKKLTQSMSEETKRLLFESQEDGFSKIRFKIYGLPQEPSFKIKTHFLELDIG